jgi:hypothetical protein
MGRTGDLLENGCGHCALPFSLSPLFPFLNLAGVSILLLLTTGCSDGRPSRVPVSGQVLIDGRPLAHGQIQFIPQGSRASRGVLDEQGRFTLSCFDKGDGAIPGLHTVVIFGSEPLSSTKMIWHAPKKYTDASTSGVKQEITGPVDNVVIRISWGDGQPFVEDENTGATEVYRPSAKQR